MQRRTTSGNFDPYHKWLGLPPGKWMPTHFELLGLSIDEEEPSVIELAIKRQRDFMKGMRGGKFPELVDQILIQIQDAEITLLEPDSRRQYVEKSREERVTENQSEVDYQAVHDEVEPSAKAVESRVSSPE